MRSPLRQVRIHEDEQVALGDEQRFPQGLALAGIAGELGRDVTGPVYGRAAFSAAAAVPSAESESITTTSSTRGTRSTRAACKAPTTPATVRSSSRAGTTTLIRAPARRLPSSSASAGQSRQCEVRSAVPRLRAAVHSFTPWLLPRPPGASPDSTRPGDMGRDLHRTSAPILTCASPSGGHLVMARASPAPAVGGGGRRGYVCSSGGDSTRNGRHIRAPRYRCGTDSSGWNPKAGGAWLPGC